MRRAAAAAAATATAAAAVTMTSQAPTSWFSGLARSSSSTMAGGVASAPASASASASASLPDAPKSSVVGAGPGGGKRNHLRGALFKYGPKSAQVRAVVPPPPPSLPVAPLAAARGYELEIVGSMLPGFSQFVGEVFSPAKFWNPRWSSSPHFAVAFAK